MLLLKNRNNKITVLITDFGLSRVIGHGKEEKADKATALSRTYCGTPGYMAPEILEEKAYNAFQADVWSAGICLYEVLNGCLPFKQAESKLVLVAEVARDWTWNTENVAEEPSEGVKALVSAMLDPEPATRVTMTAALSYKWMAPHVKYARSCFYKSASGSTGKSIELSKSKGKTKINNSNNNNKDKNNNNNNKGKDAGMLKAAVAKSKINKSR